MGTVSQFLHSVYKGAIFVRRFVQLQPAQLHVAILSRDKVARQNRAIKIADVTSALLVISM